MATINEWLERGTEAHLSRRSEEALEAYEEALRLDPGLANAWNGKGRALNDLDRHEAALEAYDEAIRLDPTDAIPWNNKGNALKNLGRYEAALEAFEEAIRLAPGFAVPWFNRVYPLRELKNAKDEPLALRAHRSLLHGLHLVRQAERPTPSRLLNAILRDLRDRRAAPLLVLSLFEAFDLLEAYLRRRDYYDEALLRCRPFHALRDHRATGRGTLGEADWLTVLGLGAFYLGDPFTAHAYFSDLDDLDEADLLGQFYLARTYEERLDDIPLEGLVEIARDHAEAAMRQSERGEGVDAERLYYAGHLFAFAYEPDPPPREADPAPRWLIKPHLPNALRCFTASAERGFLPARYMEALLLDALDRHTERDAALREILDRERRLAHGQRDGFLQGVALGHVEVGEAGWERPFRKYAHYRELQGALELVHDWLSRFVDEQGALPDEWAFAERAARAELPEAWEVWELTDLAYAHIEREANAARQELRSDLRAAVEDYFATTPELLDAQQPPEELEWELARRIELAAPGAAHAPYVTLVRYHAYGGTLTPEASVFLMLFVRARHPDERTFKALAEKALEGALLDATEQPADALLILLGAGGAVLGAPAAGAQAVLVHLAVQFVGRLGWRERRYEAYGEFKRDFYRYLAGLRKRTRRGLFKTMLEEAGIHEGDIPEEA